MTRLFALLAPVLVGVVVAAGLRQSLDPMPVARVEREFSQTSVERGQRDSFLAYFAPDGVRFVPEPVNARESLLATPPEPTPRPRILEWEPLFVRVAASGDLGVSTGPVEIRENKDGQRVLWRGWYFSMWKKQADGNWRVVADLGFADPTAPPLRSRPLYQSQSPAGAGTAGDLAAVSPAALTEFDRGVCARAAKDGLWAAYSAHLDAESRVGRAEHAPAIGPDAIKGLLASEGVTESRSPLESRVSAAGDLGYTYGRYEASSTDRAGVSKTAKGSYVRVWKRSGPSAWTLVADIVTF